MVSVNKYIQWNKKYEYNKNIAIGFLYAACSYLIVQPRPGVGVIQVLPEILTNPTISRSTMKLKIVRDME